MGVGEKEREHERVSVREGMVRVCACTREMVLGGMFRCVSACMRKCVRINYVNTPTALIKGRAHKPIINKSNIRQLLDDTVTLGVTAPES